MSERSGAMEQHAVHDGAPNYRAAPAKVAADYVPPGYKRTEVGVVPESWGTAVLHDIAGCLDNLRIPLNESQRKKMRGEIPYCGANGVLDYVDDFVIDDDIILMAEDGGHFEEYETRPIAYRMRGKCWINNHAHVLKAKSNLDQGFLFYSLVHKNILPFLASGTRVKLNKSEMNKIVVALPPQLKEQRAIATALSDADALIDSLIRLIANKRAIKQAAMQQLLTGQTRLPGFEGKWKTRWLGDVARIGTGDRNNQDKTYQGKYPFFVRSESIERIDSYSFDCEAILVPGEGRIGNIFHYINGKFDVHQRVYAIRGFDNSVDARFVYFYMVHQFGAWAFQNTVKATVDSLRLPTFKKFPMEMPVSVNEQSAIAGLLSNMDNEIEALELRRDKARQMKQGMMQQLLTGRVRLVKLDKPKSSAC